MRRLLAAVLAGLLTLATSVAGQEVALPPSVLFQAVRPILDLAPGTTTSSTIPLSFRDVGSSSGYQYSISSTGASSGFGAWTTLSSKTISSGLSASTQYWIKVRAVRGSVNGPDSNTVTATTQSGGGGALTFTAVGQYRGEDGTSSNNPYGTASFSTGSFTPAANSLLVVVVGVFSETNINGSDITITDNLGAHLTYTQRLNPKVLAIDYYQQLYFYTAPVGGSPSSMQVVVDHANSIHQWYVQVFTLEGYNTGAPVGATASSTSLGDGTQTLTLSGAPASTNSYVIAARAATPTTTVLESATPTSGWTEDFDVGTSASNGWGGLQSQHRTGSTSTTVSWDDLMTSGSVYGPNAIGGAVEFK